MKRLKQAYQETLLLVNKTLLTYKERHNVLYYSKIFNNRKERNYFIIFILVSVFFTAVAINKFVTQNPNYFNKMSENEINIECLRYENELIAYESNIVKCDDAMLDYLQDVFYIVMSDKTSNESNESQIKPEELISDLWVFYFNGIERTTTPPETIDYFLDENSVLKRDYRFYNKHDLLIKYKAKYND